MAQNTDEPELFSTATVVVSTVDENDNKLVDYCMIGGF